MSQYVNPVIMQPHSVGIVLKKYMYLPNAHKIFLCFFFFFFFFQDSYGANCWVSAVAKQNFHVGINGKTAHKSVNL